MNMASPPILMLMIIFSMWLLISYSESTEYVAGGDSENLWKVHLPSRQALTQWDSNHQFRISDTIMFEHENKVNEDGCINCNEESHSKMGLKLDDVAVKSKPLVIPPLVTLPQPPSPAPSPNSSGCEGAPAGREFIAWLGLSSLIVMFLI